MARPIQKPKEEYLQQLRAEINKKFISNISSANDCTALGAAIFLKTQHLLSVDTVRRLFALKKSNSLPSRFTLDACAKYLDYHDWEEFVQIFAEKSALNQKVLLFDVIEERDSFESLLSQINANSKSTDLYENFSKIILYKAQIRDELFFTRIFEFTTIFKYQEPYKYDIYYTIHLLGALCNRYDWLGNIAVSHYHTIPYKDNYFVEWLVVPEKTYYLPLLENYYDADRNTKSVVVFYHLIQCTVYAEQKNWEALELSFQKLVPLVVGSYTLNSILKMRWLGVQLQHDLHFFEGANKNSIWKRIFNSPQINEKDGGDCITCIFIISQYLCKAAEYEMIIMLYEQKAVKSATLLGHWGELNFNQLSVLYALALLRTDRKAEALVIFDKIKVNQFDLNFKSQMISTYNILVENLK